MSTTTSCLTRKIGFSLPRRERRISGSLAPCGPPIGTETKANSALTTTEADTSPLSDWALKDAFEELIRKC